MVGRYWPDSGRVDLAGGGHPPALLVSGDTVQEIAAPGIPLGWPGAGSHACVSLTLDRSDTLVLYTDGLIEATKDILVGLAALSTAALATASYPAEGMARALVERALEGADRHDDSLALVIRRRVPPVAVERRHLLRPFEHRFSPNAANVGIARHLLRDWLQQVPVPAPETEDALLVAAELTSNAIRHASGTPGGVVLRAAADGDNLVIEVEDDGGSLELPERPGDIPDPDAEAGRGLFLVRSLTDEVEATVREGRTIVRATRRAVLPAADPEPSRQM
jgi:anti-sigma regulatory factor (Ser/Thr protein kinase)